ncbi:MAG: carboxypeptidase regulatory-like domain-containing protein [bacterium]|nr:carboxypeptidase regulatory-like domain-containing protein [bacterium]
MKVLMTILLLAGAAFAVWYALDEPVAIDDVAALVPEAGARPDAIDAPEPAAAEELLVAPGAAPATTESSQRSAPDAGYRPLAVEGTVTDRFGAPVGGERVFVLAANQVHPPEGAELGAYATARTSKSGKFTVAVPNAGPWRLSVGPPGAPRLTPSDARPIEAGVTADVIVPGSALLRVVFDGGSANVAVESVELLALRSEPERTSGRGRGGRAERRANRVPRNRPAAPQPSTPDGASGGETLGNAPRPPTPPASEGAPSKGSVGAGDGAQGGARMGGTESVPKRNGDRPRGQRGQRGQRAQRRGEANQEAPLAPAQPREVWRRVQRREVQEKDRAAATMEFRGLTAGQVARLAVHAGGERLEGAGRFSLVADTVTVVRVFPIEAGPKAALNYVTTVEPAPEMQVGVTWRERQ